MMRLIALVSALLVTVPALAAPPFGVRSGGEFPVSQALVQTVDITASTTGDHEVAFSRVFPEGELTTLPSTSVAAMQVDGISKWPDGSWRHIMFASAAMPLVAATPLTVNIYSTPVAEGAAMDASDIASAVSAAGTTSVQFGSIGTVTLSALTGTPDEVIYAGPEMVEAVYSAVPGGDATLLAKIWVRLFSTGLARVQVLATNGYTTNYLGTSITKNYVPTVTIDGSVVWNNGGSSYAHYGHTSWFAEGWIGTPPDVYVDPSPTALMASKMVPNYGWTGTSEATLNALDQSYVQGDRGPWDAAMGSGGYQQTIGPLTIADAILVKTGDERAFDAGKVSSLSLLSYPIIWFDPTTKTTPKLSDYPTTTTDGAGVGGSDNWSTDGVLVFDLAHHGSAGFVPFLVTGDRVYLDILGGIAASCYLGASPSWGSSTARTIFNQERHQAWCYRSIAQFVAASPDGDSVSAEYSTWLEHQFSFWRAVIEDPQGPNGPISWSGATMNAAGYYYAYSANGTQLIEPGVIRSFFHYFLGGSIGYARDLKPFSDQTDLIFVENWIGKTAAGQLGPGGTGNFCFTRAGLYNITVSAVDNQDPTLWYDSWEDIDNATSGGGACGNTLGNTPNIATGYWANGMYHWAYACEHGVTGACAGLDRVQGATNWAGLRDAGFENVPWGIWPRGRSVN